MTYVFVNGEKTAFDGGTSLGALLKREGFDTARVAVEKNGEIIPKSGFDSVELRGGDRLEVVSFVGGG